MDRVITLDKLADLIALALADKAPDWTYSDAECEAWCILRRELRKE